MLFLPYRITCILLLSIVVNSICYRFVAGVISHKRLKGFMQVLWRASKGNIFMSQVSIEEPIKDAMTVSCTLTTYKCIYLSNLDVQLLTLVVSFSQNALVFKTVFVLFFQGHALSERVKKICEG